MSATVPACSGPSSSRSPRSRSPDPPPLSRRSTGCRPWTTASRSPSPATRPTGQRRQPGARACSCCTGSPAYRGTVDAIASAFANAGYSVLAYDARGHGASGGEITLAGPREVADLRALRNAFAARPEVSDTIGAWGISYGGGQVWNALSSRSAARSGRGGRDLDVALRRALAAEPRPLRDRPPASRRASSARSPLVAGIRRRRRPARQPRRRACPRGGTLAAARLRLDQDARLSSSRARSISPST